MTRFRVLAGVGLAAASAAAWAAFAKAPPPSAPTPVADRHEQCFDRHDIEGFSAPNDHTVYIRVGVRDIYRLDLMNDCTGLTFHQGLALESQPDDAWVCNPLGETVIIRDAGIPQHCPVTAITKLTPDQIAALPKRDVP